MTPIKVFVVWPKDYPVFAPRYAVRLEVDSWIKKMRTWFKRQGQVTFDYTLTTHESRHTIYDLGKDPNDPNAPSVIYDCHGLPQGAHASAVALKVLHEELDLMHWDRVDPPYRIGIVLVGGGGWAGGFEPGDQNHGWWMVGDWGLRWDMTDVPDVCAVETMGVDAASKTGYLAFAHEALHAFGVDSHHPYVMGGDTLTLDQKCQLRAGGNQEFLTKVN